MKVKPYFRFSSLITHAYVMVTEHCPLRCEYCYIKDRDIQNEVSLEDVDTLINRFNVPVPRLIFFGGEPLMKLDLIKKIVDKYQTRCRYQIVTSGLVHWDRAVEELILPYKDYFDYQVSWDGFETYTRLLKHGDDRSITVFNNILKIAQEGIRVEIRSVINDSNIDQLRNLITLFRELNRAYPDVTGDLTISHQVSFKEDFADKLFQQLKLIYDDYQVDLRTRERKAYLPRFLLNKLLDTVSPVTTSSCDAGSYVVMKPDGTIHPCTILSQSNKFLLGHISQSNLDWDKLTSMRKCAATDECQSCSMRGLCDGGCRYERIEVFGDEWCSKIHKHTCQITKALYEASWYLLESLTPVERKIHSELETLYRLWNVSYDSGDHQTADHLRDLRRGFFKDEPQTKFNTTYFKRIWMNLNE